jgi:RNA polymerase sigma-70 factor, ECF subfamily
MSGAAQSANHLPMSSIVCDKLHDASTVGPVSVPTCWPPSSKCENERHRTEHHGLPIRLSDKGTKEGGPVAVNDFGQHTADESLGRAGTSPAGSRSNRDMSGMGSALSVVADQAYDPPISVSRFSDEELARRSAAGHPQAFDELVRRHQDRLYTLAYRVVWDQQDAIDCVQEALFRAWKAIARFRSDAKVSTWLHQIVLRVAYDCCAARKRRPQAATSDVDSHPELAAVDRDPDDRLDLVEALRGLDMDFRAVVVACDVFGMSLLEAAEALGVPEGTVKSRRSRGLARIAATLAANRS